MKQFDNTLSNDMQHLNAAASCLRQETKSATMLLRIGCAMAALVAVLLRGLGFMGWFTGEAKNLRAATDALT